MANAYVQNLLQERHKRSRKDEKCKDCKVDDTGYEKCDHTSTEMTESLSKEDGCRVTELPLDSCFHSIFGMSDITSIKEKNDSTEEKCKADDTGYEKSDHTSTEITDSLSNEDGCRVTELPLDGCFHSIFGAETPDWTKAAIKIEKDIEPQKTKSDMELCKNNSIHEVNIKKEGSSSSSYDSGKQPSDTKLFISQTAYEQYQSLLTAKIKCPNCFFTTGNRGNLKQHMKKHDKPHGYVYTCDVCGFKTKYKNSMKGHSARHEKGKSKSRKK